MKMNRKSMVSFVLAALLAVAVSSCEFGKKQEGAPTEAAPQDQGAAPAEQPQATASPEAGAATTEGAPANGGN